MVTIFSMFTDTTQHNTAKLFELLRQNLQEDYEIITPKDLNKGCRGCKSCIKRGTYCIFNKCVEKVSNSDIIYIVTPIYFFSLPSQTKAFIDCLYSIDLSGKIFAPIFVSGSQFEDSGLDLVYNTFKAIDKYCGSITITPYNKVTFDEVLPITKQDELGITHLISRALSVRGVKNAV